MKFLITSIHGTYEIIEADDIINAIYQSYINKDNIMVVAQIPKDVEEV